MSQLSLYKVVKSNELVKARYDWTVPMHRIIMMLVAQIRLDDEDFTTQRISVRELAKLSESSAKSVYETAQEAAERLLDQKIEVRKDNGEYHGYNLMSDTHYEPGKGYIEARFNPNMKPLLLQLKQRFTQYMLKQTMPLSSPYSIRFYELIKMRKGQGYMDISIDDLRSMFRLENKYSRFRDLRRYVIDKARNELKEKCDLYFDYKIKRSGRSPVGLKLQIKKKKEARPKRKKMQPAKEKDDSFESFFRGLGKEKQNDWRKQAKKQLSSVYSDEENDWWVEAEVERIMRQRFSSEVASASS